MCVSEKRGEGPDPLNERHGTYPPRLYDNEPSRESLCEAKNNMATDRWIHYQCVVLVAWEFWRGFVDACFLKLSLALRNRGWANGTFLTSKLRFVGFEDIQRFVGTV
ncbi:hypothetical protein VTJ04DRAFT_2200 [Mycothermus thermophilus]|uniref:uncharacterized protein n=1 Tax=Humicola insolens TaxID=85995 RepID=UPI0037441E02